MAVKSTSYTLADILGDPITEQEALALIKQATDSDTFRSFNIMEEACRRKLLQFLMGKSGLSITYDSVFKHVMMPGGTTDRLEQFLSVILGEPVQIKQILPQEGSQIAESGSFIIADIIVSTRDGSIMNVEIQKIGYHFPGERASCYTADMIMRQYNYLKNRNRNFTYRDMKPVYLIVFMENSPALFKTTDQYIHKKCSYFNTDIKLNLLENIIFISLDTFGSVVHNITTKQEAWLKFLTEDNPEEIVRFVNQFPEFLPYYQDIIRFRKKPEELIHMFSDALREMDRNTERYMVEELNKQVEDLKAELNTAIVEKDTRLAEKDTVIAEKDTRLAEKDTVIAEKDTRLVEKDTRLAEQESLIRELSRKLARYESEAEK